MRLAIKLSDDMASKVDNFAKSFGMSKSSFMSYCIGSHIRTLESQDKIVDEIKKSLRDNSNFSNN